MSEEHLQEVKAIYDGDVEEAYKDPYVLEYLYHECSLSLAGVAKLFDMSREGIRHQMEKNEIPRRDWLDSISKKHATYQVGMNGYPSWNASEGEFLRVHRLVAVAKGHEPHDVFSNEFNTHHKNGVKWDNRPDNIELVKHGEHQRGHVIGENNPDASLSKAEVKEIRRRYEQEENATTYSLAEEYPVGRSMIGKIVNRKVWTHI